jgi:hypothetical protein
VWDKGTETDLKCVASVQNVLGTSTCARVVLSWTELKQFCFGSGSSCWFTLLLCLYCFWLPAFHTNLRLESYTACISHIYHFFYTTHPSHSLIWLQSPSLEFCPTSCHFLPLRSKYSLQHPVLLIHMLHTQIISDCILVSMVASIQIVVFWVVTPRSFVASSEWQSLQQPVSVLADNILTLSYQLWRWKHVVLWNWYPLAILYGITTQKQSDLE